MPLSPPRRIPAHMAAKETNLLSTERKVLSKCFYHFANGKKNLGIVEIMGWVKAIHKNWEQNEYLMEATRRLSRNGDHEVITIDEYLDFYRKLKSSDEARFDKELKSILHWKPPPKPVIAGDFVLVDLGKKGWQPAKVLKRVRGFYDVKSNGRRYVVQINQMIKTEEPKKTIKKSSKLWRLRKQLMASGTTPVSTKEDLFEDSSENELDEDDKKSKEFRKAKVRFEEYLERVSYTPRDDYSEIRAKKGIGSKPRFFRRKPESPMPKKEFRVSLLPIPKTDLRESRSRTPDLDQVALRSSTLKQISELALRSSRSSSSSYGLPPTPRGFASKKQPQQNDLPKQLGMRKKNLPTTIPDSRTPSPGPPLTPITPSPTPRFANPPKRKLKISMRDDDSLLNYDFDAMWSGSQTPNTTPRKRSPSVASVVRSSTVQFQTPRGMEEFTDNSDVLQAEEVSEFSNQSETSSQLTRYEFPILAIPSKTDEVEDISSSSPNQDKFIPQFLFPQHVTSPKEVDTTDFNEMDIPEISSPDNQFQFPSWETPPRTIDLSISILNKQKDSMTFSPSGMQEIDQDSTSSSTLVRLKVLQDPSSQQQDNDDQSSVTGSSCTSESSNSYSPVHLPWTSPRRFVDLQNLATDDTLLNTVDKSLIEKLKDLRMQYKLIE